MIVLVFIGECLGIIGKGALVHDLELSCGQAFQEHGFPALVGAWHRADILIHLE